MMRAMALDLNFKFIDKNDERERERELTQSFN